MSGRQEGRLRGSDAALLRTLGVQMMGWLLVAASLYVRSKVGPEQWSAGWLALATVGTAVVIGAFVEGFRIRLRQIRSRSGRT